MNQKATSFYSFRYYYLLMKKFAFNDEQFYLLSLLTSRFYDFVFFLDLNLSRGVRCSSVLSAFLSLTE